MEAISNHAKQAAKEQQARRHSEDDLEAKVGATIGDAYLTEYDGEDIILVVTGVTHDSEPLPNGEWKRSYGVPEDEFERGIQVHTEFYRIRSILNGAYVTHDDPFKTPTFYREALHNLHRKPLETGVKDNTYAHPASL